MFLPLLLGFGAVAITALVSVLRRGRASAAVVLVIAGTCFAVLAWMLNGRAGLGDMALGALLGLPVLIGSVLHRDRTETQSTV